MPERPWEKRVAIATSVFTAIIAVATVCYVHSSIDQLDVMRDQLKQMALSNQALIRYQGGACAADLQRLPNGKDSLMLCPIPWMNTGRDLATNAVANVFVFASDDGDRVARKLDESCTAEKIADQIGQDIPDSKQIVFPIDEHHAPPNWPSTSVVNIDDEPSKEIKVWVAGCVRYGLNREYATKTVWRFSVGNQKSFSAPLNIGSKRGGGAGEIRLQNKYTKYEQSSEH